MTSNSFGAAVATTPAPTMKPIPKLWAKLSVRTGNAIQLAAIAGGAAAVIVAARFNSLPSGARFTVMMAGWLAIYLCSHAIAHFAVGRVVGIRFRSYGVRGTDHPENYPPGVRRLMSVLPMWSAITDRQSMSAADRWAKAAMFAAGETSTTVMSIATAALAASAGIPGAHALLSVTVVWAVAATITVAIVPKGDYAKALGAIRLRNPRTVAPPSRLSRTTGARHEAGVR